jgi:hypothetical protein
MIPKVIPQVIPKIIPHVIPKIIPQIVPKVAPRVIPKVVPKIEPKVPKSKGQFVPKEPGLATLPDITHMNYRITLNRLQFGIVKSGLQKSIRRCALPEAYSYVIEADLYSLLNNSIGRGKRTNIMNRLRVSLVEDMFNWSLILKIGPWFSKWDTEREFPSSRKYLLSIVQDMIASKKTRLLSDLKVFMLRETYRNDLGDQYDYLFNGWNDTGVNTRAPMGFNRFDRLNMFAHLIEQHNPNCLYWYQKMHENREESLIWKYLLESSKQVGNRLKTIQQLQIIQSQLTKNHKESYLFTVSAIMMVLFDNFIDWNHPDQEHRDLPDLMSDLEAERMYQEHISRWSPENLPYKSAGWLPAEVVIDKHTAKGLAMGKNAMDFAVTGSLVCNQDPTFLFPILRHIYIEKKVVEVDPSKKRTAPPLDINQPTKPWVPLTTEPVGPTEQHVHPKPRLPSQPIPVKRLPSQPIPVKRIPPQPVPPEHPSNRITLADLEADENGPIYGQKVTASWKPKTYLTQRWVYKGPYTGKRVMIPTNTEARYRKFKLYGDDAAMSQEVVEGPDQQVYLRSPNIGEKWPPITTVANVTGEIIGRIADRISMGVYQGKDLIDLHKMDWERCLYHFMVRYIINAGDSGYYNYLNNYGIDYEEDRTPDKKKPENIVQIMFKKKPSEKYEQATQQAIRQHANTLKAKIETLVLPIVTGEELKRTHLVLSLLDGGTTFAEGMRSIPQNPLL